MWKKILTVSAIVIVVLVAVGYFGIEYLFSRYIFKPSLAGIQSATATQSAQPPKSAQATPKPTAGAEQTKPSASPKTGNKVVDSISEVSKSPTMTQKLEGQISVADKARVMAIVLSVFSQSEVNSFYGMASDGLSAEDRSKMMSMARKRFSPEQKRELMNIYLKYMDRVTGMLGAQ